MSDFTGIEAWAAELVQAGGRAGDEIRPVMRWAGRTMAAYQRQNAPRRTGVTAESIGFDVDQDGLGVEAGTESWYAPFVEGGSPRSAPRPFVFPALDVVADEAVDRIGDAAEKAFG